MVVFERRMAKRVGKGPMEAGAAAATTETVGARMSGWSSAKNAVAVGACAW